MAFAATTAGAGRIYMDIKLEEKTTGVLVLNYNEAKNEVSELGWTAGLSRTSGQEKCFIPNNSSSSRPFQVAGATGEKGAGENVLVFDAGEKSGETPPFATVLQFGANAGAEPCGKPTLKPPTVAYKEAENVTSVPVGANTTISSKLEGANAKKTKWVLEYTTGKGEKGKEELESGYQYGQPSLAHAFAHIGEYTIHESVETDDLGSVTATTESTKAITVTPAEPTVTLAKLAPFFAGETENLEASITDPNETKATLTLTWTFNDGSAPVEEKDVVGEGVIKRKLAHTFGACPSRFCTVVLSVVDGIAAKGSKKIEVEELEHETPPPPPPPPPPTTTTMTTPPPGGGVEPHKEVEDPKAALASTSITVAKNGSFTVKVTCPPEQPSCAGTLTVKTLNAVSAKKKAILTLASGSFSLAGGKVESVTLHLSSKGKKLLAKVHSLKALATILSHGPKGSSDKTTAVLRLLAAKKH
jgi:hypothetical protein